MARHSTVGFGLFLLLALAGCASDPSDNSLKVAGNATAMESSSAAGSGFNFATETLLYDDRVAPDNGVIAGHCTIQRGPVGVPDVIDVGITRTSAVDVTDRGMRSYAVRIDDPGSPLVGSVTTVLGTDTFTSAGGVDCNIQLLNYDIEERVATVAVSDCTVATSASATATTSASLSFVNCDVR